MFNDARSKKLVLAAHCILNQNSISDGTADYPCSIREVVDLLLESKIGILQMPCPELLCLGLDRGNVHGGEQPVVIENTRIRSALKKPDSVKIMKDLVNQLVFQIEQYYQNGFTVLGIIGINRSPTCGVDTTSSDNREVEGKGVFINELHKELEKREIFIALIGIKSSEIDQSIKRLKEKIIDLSSK